MENKQVKTTQKSSWRGYTLEEMQQARSLAMTRLKHEKSKLTDSAEQFRAGLPFVGSASPALSILRSFGKLQYIFLAIKLFRKVIPLFRKKK